MADDDAPLSFVIDDETETVHVDPDTGTVTTLTPDGGATVALRDHPPASDADGDDDFHRNLADDIDAAALAKIANDLYDAISADDRSRQGYLQIRARGLGLLGLALEEPKSTVGDSSSSLEGMSSVTNPLLLEAVLKSWANAQAELLPSQGPVKIMDDGNETAADDELAEALERGFNHYLTKTAVEYYPDTSQMLAWGTILAGSGFKKVYRCPMRRRPVAESVDATNLIVSDATKDLRASGRVTHECDMRPSVMKRMQMIGAYRDVGLTQPTPEPNAVDTKIASIQGTQPQPDRPEDQPYTIWECQCELDLPDYVPAKFKDKGIPLPYLVTMDRDTREILALRRDWKQEDAEANRKQLYVKYPYVLGPGFYGTGLLNILGNCSAAMTAAWRMSLDNAMLANFPAFMIAKLGGRQNTSNMRVGPGQGVPVETNGLPIAQIAAPLPYRDVTNGMLAMIDKVSQQAKEAGGTADMPVGEGIQNVPVGTMLAQIEQATKVMSAAHKGMVQAQAAEFDLLLDLFREHPEDFIAGDGAAPNDYWTQDKVLQALDAVTLVPVADPNTPSHIHRVAKALALVQLIAMPVFAPLMSAKETLLRCLRAIREDPNGLVQDAPPTQPQADPAAMAKVMDAQTKQQKLQLDAQELQQQGQVDQMKLAGERDIQATELAKEMVIHGDQQASDERDAQRAQLSDQRSQLSDQRQQDGDAALGLRQQQIDRSQQVAQQALAEREHTLDVSRHGLEIAQAQHDAKMAEVEANKPEPKPAPKAKPKG